MSDPTPIVDVPSKPPQRFRRMRIAASVFFGVVTVALCVLWVRSYWYFESVSVRLTTSKHLEAESAHGFANIAVMSEGTGAGARFAFESFPISEELASRLSEAGSFRAAFHRSGWLIRFPYWCAAIAVTVPYLLFVFGPPTRFSLRTMLIATTLVAVVLGLAVWAMR